MPLELQLIRASEFIRVNAEGDFDLGTSKLALTKLAHACRKRGIERAMLDLRELHPLPQPRLTRTDLIALVNTFHQVFSKEHRLALLYSTDPHARARLFACITSMHGWQVRSFASFENAMFWLSQEETEERNPDQHKRLHSVQRRSNPLCRGIRL
jgi:hypothetical protein